MTDDDIDFAIQHLKCQRARARWAKTQLPEAKRILNKSSHDLALDATIRSRVAHEAFEAYMRSVKADLERATPTVAVEMSAPTRSALDKAVATIGLELLAKRIRAAQWPANAY